MIKHQIRYVWIVSVILSLSTVFTACEKDKPGDNNTPAYFIAESEKVSIPGAVALPNDPGGHQRVKTYYAIGIQEYKSQMKADSSGYEWIFFAPYADLYDESNAKVGTHSAGPSWQLLLPSTDTIRAQQFDPVRKVLSPDGNHIDWLLLKTKEGKVPTGVFTDVAYIQRIATRGGKAPVTPPTGLFETVKVPYTAVYRLTKRL